VSETTLVQYVGFESKALVREYTFNVRHAAEGPREFTLTITNEAFNCHRVRYQDAPDVCSLKLQRELVANANHPPNSHFRLSDAELEDYRTAHTHKPRNFFAARKAEQDF
jgi:hypothetical protein